MAGTEQTWNTTFENNPSTSSDPSDHPGEVQDFKLTIRKKLEHEHVGDVNGVDDAHETGVPFTGIHRQGSAKVWSQATEPTHRPGADSDGTALTDDDAGRLWHDTDDDALYVAVDDGATGVTFTHIFEATDISDTAPATIKSLQDKIDALAAQIKAITGEAAWDTAPDITAVTTASRLGQAVNTGSSPTFAQINTGPGMTEVHLMNQNLRSTDSPTFNALTTTSLSTTSVSTTSLAVTNNFRPPLGTLGSGTSKTIYAGDTWVPPAGWYFIYKDGSQLKIDYGATGDDLTVGTYYFDGVIGIENVSSSSSSSVGYKTYS